MIPKLDSDRFPSDILPPHKRTSATNDRLAFHNRPSDSLLDATLPRDKMGERAGAVNPCPFGTSVTEAACAPSAPEASRDT